MSDGAIKSREQCIGMEEFLYPDAEMLCTVPCHEAKSFVEQTYLRGIDEGSRGFAKLWTDILQKIKAKVPQFSGIFDRMLVDVEGTLAEYQESVVGFELDADALYALLCRKDDSDER